MERKKMKIRAWAALGQAVFAAAFLVSLSLAWMSFHKSTVTMAEIAMPNALTIRGGNVSDLLPVTLDAVDMSQAGSMQMVFCVCGSLQHYRLQVAHTTNIPLTYEIYPATASQSVPAGSYATYSDDGSDWYYAYSAAITGSTLNEQNGLGVGTNGAGQWTYEPDDLVQKNAEPIYWLSDLYTALGGSNGTEYTHVDYFVLKISWDRPAQDGAYQKETDMVYLLAGEIA